jgi:hypothetical protein
MKLQKIELEIGAGFKSTAQRSTKWLDMENMKECGRELSRGASVQIGLVMSCHNCGRSIDL